MRLILPTLVSFAALCAILRTARAQIFVTHFGNGLPGTGSISEYDATTGATVNPALVSGLNAPLGIAVSGGNLFVVNSNTGTIGKYTTSGALVNPALITGLGSPVAIAASGANLFVTDT